MAVQEGEVWPGEGQVEVKEGIIAMDKQYNIKLIVKYIKGLFLPISVLQKTWNFD